MESLTLNAAQISSGTVFAVLSAAYVGGFATAFTPCVYPLIPVTVGVMGAASAPSRRRGFLLAACFVLGLSAVYSSLGFFAAFTGKLFGSAGQNPLLVAGVSLVFLTMGLSLLGLFEFRLPSRWTTALARRGSTGFGGALVLGGVSGILAAPCAGPVVVGILAYVAQRSNPLLGFLLLYVFSLGLGTPFLVLGTFSHSLARLPRGGVWMEWVKHLCGLALIAAFFVYAKSFLPAALVFALLAFSFLLLAVFSPRLFPVRSGWGVTHTAMRLVFAVVTGVTAMRAVDEFRAKGEAPGRGIVWVLDLDEALRRASSERKPVLVDVWAEWCEACKELEEKTYSDPSVRDRLARGFVTVKIDATDPNEPAVEPFLKKYGVAALPAVLFLSPSGELQADLTLTGFLPPEDFLKLLDRAEKRSKR